MRVQNPNSRELPIKGINYRIEVNDAELGQGLTNHALRGARHGRGRVRRAVHGQPGGHPGQVADAPRLADTLDYRLVGEVALSSGFLRRIPFDERGSVKL